MFGIIIKFVCLESTGLMVLVGYKFGVKYNMVRVGMLIMHFTYPRRIRKFGLNAQKVTRFMLLKMNCPIWGYCWVGCYVCWVTKHRSGRPGKTGFSEHSRHEEGFQHVCFPCMEFRQEGGMR